MDQLVVLQAIYESFSNGPEGLKSIDPASIEGNCSEQVGRLLESAKQGRIDQEICLSLADRLEDVYEIKRLGDISRKAGLFSLATRSYNKALSQSRDQSIRPVLLNNLGQVCARQGDMGRANVYYKKAADAFESLGDSSGLAHVLGNQASAYRRSRDWDKAIERCYKSLKLFEEMGDESGAAQMTGSLGRVYAEMGERDLAIRYFEKSLKDFQRLGDKRSTAWILDRLGRISAEAKDWNSALKYYNKSLIIFDEIGQGQGAGIVLSNLGRMYLENGDILAARDSLEKAIKLMHRDMQPAYQNTAACLAVTYGSLAAMNMRDAESTGLCSADGSANEKLRLASQFYARSSDRYLELASTRGFDLPDLKVSASITRSLSYLAKLQSGVSEEESVALAERAASSLDSAAVNSEGADKASIEALQRILLGMKSALSAGLAGSEPWKMTKSIANSIEYLLGGACRPDEAGKSLCDALRSLSGAITAERQRKDSSEQLKLAISHLDGAKKILASLGTDQEKNYALKIDDAARLIKGLVSIEISSGDATTSNCISDLLNYRAYRGALIVISRVLMNDCISRVNKADRILYIWDDSLGPVEEKSAKRGSEEKTETDRSEIEPVQEPPLQLVSGVDAQYDASEDVIEMVEPEISDDLISEATAPEGWLVPVEAGIACTSCSAQVIALPRDDVVSRTVEIIDPAAAASDSESENAGRTDMSAGPNADKQYCDNSAAKGLTHLAVFPGFEGLLTQPNGIRLVKGMIIVVAVLMAIDVILYLI